MDSMIQFLVLVGILFVMSQIDDKKPKAKRRPRRPEEGSKLPQEGEQITLPPPMPAPWEEKKRKKYPDIVRMEIPAPAPAPTIAMDDELERLEAERRAREQALERAAREREAREREAREYAQAAKVAAQTKKRERLQKSELRRAIVLSEILGAPLSKRRRR